MSKFTEGQGPLTFMSKLRAKCCFFTYHQNNVIRNYQLPVKYLSFKGCFHLLLIVFDFAAGIAWLRYQGPRFYDTTLTILRKNDLRVEALKTKRKAAKAGNR